MTGHLRSSAGEGGGCRREHARASSPTPLPPHVIRAVVGLVRWSGGCDPGATRWGPALGEVVLDPVTLIVAALATGAELLAAAQRLLQLTDPAGAYTITASGDRSVAAHTIHGGVHTGDTSRP